MLRRRLIWQLFPSFLAITLPTLVAATVYGSVAFRRFYLRHVEQQLHQVAEIVVSEVTGTVVSESPDDMDALCKRLGQAGNGQMRLTIIASDGKVLGDSERDPAGMDDHSTRDEIVKAQREGFGRSVRSSPTLGQKMMYVAVPVTQEGQAVAVVRTALLITDIDRALNQIYVSIAWAGLIVALCAAFLSLLISRRISLPVTRMKRIAQLFADGQLNIRVPTAGAAELDDLAKALNEMATQLQDRILTITRQRNELKAILSSLVEGVIAVDSRGRIVSVNKAAAGLLSIDPSHAQGRSVEELIRNVGLQQFVRDTLNSDRPLEQDVTFPGEGERFFHVHGASLVDPQAERAGAVIVLSDMTRIHRLENLRRDFVANVSHELKTPVTSIQGFVEAILEGGSQEVEQTQRYLGIIAKHASRLNAIIDDLLSLSRLEEAGDPRSLQFEPTRLRPVLEAALELSSVRAEQRNVALDLRCDETIEAKINGPLLEQAVVNLVDNAAKYSDEGNRVVIGAGVQDNEVLLSVSDTGCGIPPEHLDRIFERFYVVDKSRSRKLGGTGLGLAIVKHIALVHGGQVVVESTPGKGTTFTMHLLRG